MNLGAIKRPAGMRKQRKRVGRGEGSGWGKTCGKGQKGQNYREQVNPRMEGGQNPLYRRLPHMRGKTNRAMNIGMFRKHFAVLNVAQLDRFEPNTDVTPELLKDAGLVKQVRDGIKILGNGEVTKPLNVTVHAVSDAARQKIEAAGGTVRVGS
jgi:large subunit ribosomal protein L15